MKLYRCFVDGDADLVEINPLILTPDGQVHALDAKVTLDDNAEFRHPEWDEYTRDRSARRARAAGAQQGPAVRRARRQRRHHRQRRRARDEHVDIVNQVGGSPANFLDIGGGANAEVMANALEVINNDPNVRSIFINIFGGITKGEEVANGIVQALEQVEIASPIVIRLDGTNAERGPRDPQAARVGPAASASRRCSTPRARPSSWRRRR